MEMDDDEVQILQQGLNSWLRELQRELDKILSFTSKSISVQAARPDLQRDY
jgi:hypothetical protein